MQDKENRSGSPEKQVDKDDKEEEGTQFSNLYKTLKQPTKIGRTMADNLSVPLAFIGEQIAYNFLSVVIRHPFLLQPYYIFATKRI